MSLFAAATLCPIRTAQFPCTCLTAKLCFQAKKRPLIAAADRFVGGTSGGSHVAAAFDVPALVIAWRSILDHLHFPVSGQGVVAAFLYPQQWFIAAEDVSAQHFRAGQLRDLLRQMLICGREGRPTGIGNHRRSPCGFAPAVPRRLIREAGRFRFSAMCRMNEKQSSTLCATAGAISVTRGKLTRTTNCS